MQIAERISSDLDAYSRNVRRLPGLSKNATREALTLQIVSSLRRLEYTEIIKRRPIDPERADPQSTMFDPERAALIHARAGRLDEAFWLTFLATHVGKHGKSGWRRLKDIYSGLGQVDWTWSRVSADPSQFRRWLAANEDRIGGGFSNHRKYESLRADSRNGTATVVESYVNWIGPSHSHEGLVGRLVQAGGNDPHSIFDQFYRSMRVARFGRLGKFDFLALVGRLDLAPISPGTTYLKNATGPLRGARLLFGGDVDADLSANALEAWIQDLDKVLSVGMQVMEDSLCNWQKSPFKFVHFKG